MSDMGLTEEQLRMLDASWNYLNRPDGEYVLSVETHDRELLATIQSLNLDEVEIREILMKGGDHPTLIHVIANNLSGFFTAITAIALFLKARETRIAKQQKTQKTETRTKGKIRAKKDVAKIKKSIAKLVKFMDITINNTGDYSEQDDESKKP
jgi:hypothetical protein